ncbi:MAG: hypothetical protein A2X86_02980 [Bdellovibrionales bacterium GWA2_49_15]|nr:MAG: hypothetical protein A2X86_02980 [Bdellovibrionales bacterium GWA2_49_15]HAZ14096.1 hypothetical protein [Bdellovibrionales bacterium]
MSVAEFVAPFLILSFTDISACTERTVYSEEPEVLSLGHSFWPEGYQIPGKEKMQFFAKIPDEFESLSSDENLKNGVKALKQESYKELFNNLDNIRRNIDRIRESLIEFDSST